MNGRIVTREIGKEPTQENVFRGSVLVPFIVRKFSFGPGSEEEDWFDWALIDGTTSAKAFKTQEGAYGDVFETFPDVNRSAF